MAPEKARSLTGYESGGRGASGTACRRDSYDYRCARSSVGMQFSTLCVAKCWHLSRSHQTA
ncbi:hypothetical protein CVE34_19075 [Pseudomonas syringae pv. actinidiae]|uniref:Uncharacterized protein n=1 Tax=Pseudomonas syringae pv. actinidiae TaxID=103796 RepID=A0AAU8XLP3_PSESF|nr:hypothetical protein CT122_25075 [Pseudomonas syringae pv. actinidiae]NAS66082.1 hypothetical protein [Pseudomonas syringae pv. actinidiae]NAS72978.1 hypothetical protein [Pseudomonas syringae pv. actinidiae]NAS80324.1 hypothetical protein [Pseudomonas syringae pv. actinidiae]NAT04976.1 hypothetical protein [Pseudomonas syringae pv. actinidiae]